MNGGASLSISRPGKLKALPIDSQQRQSYLFSLPAEIRNLIYELVLRINEEPVKMEGIPKNHLSILQTCHRVLMESETVFFAIHRFQQSPQLSRIGSSRRDAITAVSIVTTSGATASGMMEGLHQFPNLKSLYFERAISVRYLNISEWAIMRRQIQSELAKLPSLVEVRIVAPLPTTQLTETERPRAEKLASIDADLVRGFQPDAK